VGAFWRIGDAGDLLHHGAAMWQLILFGVPTAATGLYLWNGLGPNFGPGPARGNVDRRAAVGLFLTLALLISMEILCFGQS